MKSSRLRDAFYDLLRFAFSGAESSATRESLRGVMVSFMVVSADLLDSNDLSESDIELLTLVEELRDGHCTCESCGIKGDDFKLVCSEDLIYQCSACEE